ncbi:hypothetical protein ACEN9Z_11965, partial [Stenotrophomonas geniculata]
MSTRFDPPERGPLGPDVATVVTAPIVAPPSESAVSWGAIFAGAAAAAALSLILLILGVGLGLSSVSPWSFEGVSKETFGWSSIAWLTFTALAASGLGGYLAGRLRTKWTQIHGDETYFRDTAHVAAGVDLARTADLHFRVDLQLQPKRHPARGTAQGE